MRNVVFVMLLLSSAVAGLVLGRGQFPQAGIRTQHVHMKLAPVPASKVNIFSDADAVGKYVMARVEAAAAEAIAQKGHFALAIPGGSILKMLGGSPAWAKDCTLAYVNHKAVPMDDAKLATHAKASKLFLDAWKGIDCILMSGSEDAVAEAVAYEEKMRAVPPSKLPVNPAGYPIFDMMLIGVGDDGHVGSLYPGRDEVLDASGRWVLPVEKKQPGSITLSLPVMAAAKEVLIAACGVSDKYPQGKSAAMARGIEGDETPSSFPAVGLRGVATWALDAAAASTLSFDYSECFSLTMTRGDCNPPDEAPSNMMLVSPPAWAK
jgi:6-phosphogluconolactonase